VRTAVVLFTRDLRVHDNPALAAAAKAAEFVVPLFVLDPRVPSNAGRDHFLARCLADLRNSLRGRGADLVIRHGDPVAETLRVASEVDAEGIGLMADASAYARRRERTLHEGAGRRSVRTFPGVTVVPPGDLQPSGGGDHYKVFTPYHRSWLAAPRRPVEQPPRRLALPPGDLATGRLPATGRASGGETAARQRIRAWRGRAAEYGDRHDDLAGDATSRLSPYLHFGCLSALELVSMVDGADPFVRQVCWRDFYTQVLYRFPDLRVKAYRAGAAERWRRDDEALSAWQQGRTGVPVVDAGMRQLAVEGWMHNRARLITASFLTKHLGLDWRAGAAWFDGHLLDADVANNHGNWQWVAGTGTDTKPYRRFNPVRQAHRFDPDGEYVRRYVPELAGVPGGAVHEPWKRSDVDYPPPLAVDR
jgi:deoxyribodipyrimidine photo-lyase